jgi:SPP1 gp7 family putative phage head morphogenesis protein
MMPVYDDADRLRRALLARNEDTMRALTDAYGVIYQDSLSELRSLTDALRAQFASAEVVDEETFMRTRRFRLLMEQIDQRLVQYAEFASLTIENAVRQEVRYAQRDADLLIRAIIDEGLAPELPPQLRRAAVDEALRSFSRLPTAAVEFEVGVLADGTSLRNYFLSGTSNVPALSAQVVERLRQRLSFALAAGWGPERTAQELRSALGIGLDRALRIARTEQLRAYRETTRWSYQSYGIQSWRWIASLDRRTCMACLMLDGRVFSVEEPQPAHVNCRCTIIPVVPGIEVSQRRRVRNDEDRYEFFEGTGEQWFLARSEATQREMLGEAKYEAWRRGEFQLQDLIYAREHPEFGLSYTEAPLAALLRR